MAYVSSNYVSSSNIVTVIKGFLDAGSKGGTFLALTCTNTPDATKSYRIRYTTTPGASSQILEAWEATDPSLYYVATANVNASYIGTWQQFALNSNLGNCKFEKISCAIPDPPHSGGLTHKLTATFSRTLGVVPYILGIKYTDTWGGINAYGENISGITTTGFDIEMTFLDENVRNNVHFLNVYAVITT